MSKAGFDSVGVDETPAQGPAAGAELLDALGLVAEDILIEAADLVDGAQHTSLQAEADHAAQSFAPQLLGLDVGPPVAASLDLVLLRYLVAVLDVCAPVQALVRLLVCRPRSVWMWGCRPRLVLLCYLF